MMLVVSDFCDIYSVVDEMELSRSFCAGIVQLVLTACIAYASDDIDSAGIVLSVMQQ